MKIFPTLLAACLGFCLNPVFAQEQTTKVPVSTQLTLDASNPVQRPVISSVVMMHCKKTDMKGTGFALSDGTVVTAAHVLCGCRLDEIEASTTNGQHVTFAKYAHDDDRDIAGLRPTQPLQSGLELAPDRTVEVAERVNTWGFPLIYSGPAPLISVGYVSGYYKASPPVDACGNPQNNRNLQVTHIVVNGAFNPGNSGGPLFVFGQNKVVGLVVWKEIAFSETVRVAVDGFTHPTGAQIGGNFSQKMPDGTTRMVTDQEMIGRVLEEFYNKVQVDIGEAIAVSEVRAFLKQHDGELK